MGPMHRRRSWVRLAVLLGIVVFGLAGAGVGWWLSGGGRRPAAGPPRRPPVFAVPAWSLVATVSGSVPGYASPTPLATAVSIPPAWAAQFRSMPVVATAPGWDEVRVVARPPEPALAWVPANQVVLTRTPYHLVVDLTTRRLLVFVRAHLAMCPPVALGAAQDPTPTGHDFVALLIDPPPSDAGSFAILTSAVTEGVTDWEQSGTAMVTIAGSKLGSAVGTTTGSIELALGALDRLRPVPLGSPIDVVPTLPRRLDSSDARLCRSATGIPRPRARRASTR